MSDYKLGAVAMVGYDDLPPRVMMRINYGDQPAWCDANYKIQDRHERVQSIRPLVVLDLDLAAHIGVGKLVADLRDSGFYDIADQVEAQTKPSKPAEPIGLGAVVEDAEGVLWTRTEHRPNITGTVWTSAFHRTMPDKTETRDYRDIDAVRVLSEGVTA